MKSSTDEIKLKTVAYFSNSAEAGMVRELLENNGISAVMQGGNFGGLEPLLIPGGYSEIRLSVAEKDFDRARELYQAFFSSAAAFDESATDLIESPAHDEAATSAPVADEALVVITTVEKAPDGEQIARQLVERELAACVQVIAPIVSTYRWEGKIEQAREQLLLIKTTRAAYAELEAALKQLHPYQTPEIIALPVSSGSADYLAWLQDSVKVTQ
jgi:periplasmic divalent cation tolerance protein